MDHCLKQLKKLISNDEILSYKNTHFHDEYLSLFIISCDFKLKHSFHSLKTYSLSRQSHAEFFWPPTELIKRFYDKFPCSWLSPPTSPSINLLIVSFDKWDANDDEVKQHHFLASILISLQIKLLMNPFKVSKGVNIIFDFQNFNWKHFQEVDVQPFRKMLQFIDESLPIKLIRIICINSNRVSKTLMALITPFMGSNIRRKLIIADEQQFVNPDLDDGDDNKYLKLHSMIPPNHLPVDYNGYYSVISVLTNNLIHDLLKYEPSILHHWNKDMIVGRRIEGLRTSSRMFALDVHRQQNKNQTILEEEEFDLNNNSLKK